MGCEAAITSEHYLYITTDTPTWLLLDARVVAVPMTHTPTVVLRSSLKPFFFNSLPKA